MKVYIFPTYWINAIFYLIFFFFYVCFVFKIWINLGCLNTSYFSISLKKTFVTKSKNEYSTQTTETNGIFNNKRLTNQTVK